MTPEQRAWAIDEAVRQTCGLNGAWVTINAVGFDGKLKRDYLPLYGQDSLNAIRTEYHRICKEKGWE